jgi:hypothetical protein
VRLSEELARILPSGRRSRRPRELAPREIVPAPAPSDPFDAARARLKAAIPPPHVDDHGEG